MIKQLVRIKKIILISFFISFSTPPSYSFENLEIHGFASTGFAKSDTYNYIFSTENGSFEFSEIGVNLSAAMNNNIRIGMQFYSYNMGELGNNDVKLDWGFLDYKWKDSLGIRIGKVKTPYGLYNQSQDYDMLQTSIFIPQGLYTRYYRDIIIAIQGADIYGILSLGKAGKLEYDMFGGTFEIDPEGGYTLMAKYIYNVNFDSAEIDYIVGTRLKYHSPINGLLVAMTLEKYEMELNYLFANSILTANINEATLQIYSTEYNRGNFTGASEYHLHTTKSQFNESTYEAFYIQGAYRLTEWFEVGSYYSMAYWDKDNHRGRPVTGLLDSQQPFIPNHKAWQKEITITTRFDITHFWLVKLEVHFIDGTALAYPPEGKDYTDSNWMLYAIKTTFNF